MLKEPRPGHVKTRLGRDIGMTSAAWWFRHSAQSLIRRVRDPRWQITLSVAPDRDGMQSRVWPRDLRKIPQGSGDLGVRMARIFDSAGVGRVLIIGGDIPGITKGHINRAFSALGNHDLVFGPATDGGFWLAGMRTTRAKPNAMFQGVRWSGPHTLADSVASAGNCRTTLCDTLSDVDNVDDLRRLLPATAGTPYVRSLE